MLTQSDFCTKKYKAIKPTQLKFVHYFVASYSKLCKIINKIS